MWTLCNLLCLVVSFTVSVNGQNEIRKPPSITTGPEREVTFMENSAITLKCKAEGIPTVTYAWKINGKQLNVNLENLSRGSYGDLTIQRATTNDEGFYQCFATNDYGTSLSAVAHLQRAFLAKASTSDFFNQSVQEGHPFFIQAAMVNSFPTPIHKWETVTDPLDKHPKPFEESQRVNMAYNGDLYFAFAEKSDHLDRRLYSSIASNPHTRFSLTGSFTQLTITPGVSSNFPPNITHFSKSHEVALLGSWIVLECFFSGKPLPSISWSGPRNNLPFERFRYSTYKTELNISNIIESDAGDYVCTAENKIGRYRHTLNIRVEATPIFKSMSDGPRDVTVTEGDSITFNCSAFAKPVADVVWFQNGEPIHAGEAPKRFVFSNDRKHLTIRDVCRDCVDQERPTDLMVIQCNASNVHGYAFAQGYLNVLLRTKVTLLSSSRSESVDISEGNRFQFYCSAVSDPSTPPTVKWQRAIDQGLGGLEPVYNETHCVVVLGGSLTICPEGNCSATCNKYLGEYICVGSNIYTQANVTVRVNGTTDPTELHVPIQSSYLNWIVIGIAVVLFLLLLILIYCIVFQFRNRDEYDVDGKERKSGRNPEEEIQASDFQDYYPSEYVKSKGSVASLGSAENLRGMDDISEYDDDVRNFVEDGSFVGKYSEKALYK